MTVMDKACYERGCACYDDRVDKDGVEVIAQREVEAEREACAELCERMARRTNDIRRAALEAAAENIRARGQDPMPLFDDWGKDWTK